MRTARWTPPTKSASFVSGSSKYSLSSAETGRLWSYNWLIGKATIIDTDKDACWSYNAIGFQAIAGDGEPECSRFNPDLDGDLNADFNNSEYEPFPETLILPSFMEENKFRNRMVIMSHDLAGSTTLSLKIYNNKGLSTPKIFHINTWWSGPLSDISWFVTDLNGDPELPYGLETAVGGLRETLIGGVEQVGVGALVRTTNSAPQLIQLSQPQQVGSLDDERVDLGKVEP